MSPRQSLEEASSKSESGSGTDVAKVVGALVLLLAAAGVLAWSTGLIGGGPPRNVGDEAEREARFEEQAEEEAKINEQMEAPAVEAGG